MDEPRQKKKKEAVPKQIVGFTKPRTLLWIKIKSRPIYAPVPQAAGQAKPSAPASGTVRGFKPYVEKLAQKHNDLEMSLREIGSKDTPYAFVSKMVVNAAITSAAVGIAMVIMFTLIGLQAPIALLLGAVVGFGIYQFFIQQFIRYPEIKTRGRGKNVERDILFAARDLVVGMRSGMPLYNAMVAVSTGYGAASREFAKVVELVQLGTPMEQAIDHVTERSQSKTFKKIMLQASVSIRVGADVVNSLEGVVEEVTQDRVTELRRYGQKLNAVAMFYMLFGIILPSMGIAVATILTTFISIFTVTPTTLAIVVIVLIGLQMVFLNLIRGSRPSFAM